MPYKSSRIVDIAPKIFYLNVKAGSILKRNNENVVTMTSNVTMPSDVTMASDMSPQWPYKCHNDLINVALTR